jgi:hypothetical protein
MRYLSRFDDGRLMRWVFIGLLAGAVGVLAVDLNDLARSNGGALAETGSPEFAPVLPPAVDVGAPAPSTDPRPNVTADEEQLGRAMRFDLEADGVLRAEGSIVPGTSALFAEEIAKRGEYVKTVRLVSPGGALDDAMAMAELIREHDLATEVSDGDICASSCPLVLAGGTQRRIGAKAAVGVHQFYAASETKARPEQIMADAQITTARISRHLAAMGVDPALWLHALDTPPRALYYFTQDEMRDYRLSSTPDVVSSAR